MCIGAYRRAPLVNMGTYGTWFIPHDVTALLFSIKELTSTLFLPIWRHGGAEPIHSYFELRPKSDRC